MLHYYGVILHAMVFSYAISVQFHIISVPLALAVGRRHFEHYL
jgi:hypothetical protein